VTFFASSGAISFKSRMQFDAIAEWRSTATSDVMLYLAAILELKDARIFAERFMLDSN
jgi:hypothetical protein